MNAFLQILMCIGIGTLGVPLIAVICSFPSYGMDADLEFLRSPKGILIEAIIGFIGSICYLIFFR